MKRPKFSKSERLPISNGKFLEDLRKLTGQSLNAASRGGKLAIAGLVKVERGESTHIHNDTAKRMAIGYGVALEDLVEGLQGQAEDSEDMAIRAKGLFIGRMILRLDPEQRDIILALIDVLSRENSPE